MLTDGHVSSFCDPFGIGRLVCGSSSWASKEEAGLAPGCDVVLFVPQGLHLTQTFISRILLQVAARGSGRKTYVCSKKGGNTARNNSRKQGWSRSRPSPRLASCQSELSCCNSNKELGRKQDEYVGRSQPLHKQPVSQSYIISFPILSGTPPCDLSDWCDITTTSALNFVMFTVSQPKFC